MDRKRDDGRRPPREDNRNHRPRYGTSTSDHPTKASSDNFPDSERSRSPPRRDRRDDRRRERSPPSSRGPPPPPRGSGPPPRSDRERDQRGRGGPKREPLDNKSGNPGVKKEERVDIKMEDIPEDEDDEARMQRIMGFKAFKTTKNTKVPGNDRNYGVAKTKKVEYRQYMNRTGGFNRPLSPSRV